MNALAGAYFREGRIAAAAKLHEQTLKLRLDRFGPDHVDTLISEHNVALVYRQAGRLADAIRLYEKALEWIQSEARPRSPARVGRHVQPRRGIPGRSQGEGRRRAA